MSNMVITPVLHFEDINGRPLVGGMLYSYEAGSSTPTPLYMDEALTQTHPDPIVLDMRGECKAFYDPSVIYKLVLKDSDDNIIWEADHISAGDSGSGLSNVVVDGTAGEIDVDVRVVSGVRHFVVSLSTAVKNAISLIISAVNDINGKIPSSASLLNKLATASDVVNSIGKVKKGGSLTDGATVSVPNNAVSTLSSSQSSLTLNVTCADGEIPNFAVEITAGDAIALTVTKTTGGVATTLKYAESAGNTLESGKMYQITCVGSCWTLAEFVNPGA